MGLEKTKVVRLEKASWRVLSSFKLENVVAAGALIPSAAAGSWVKTVSDLGYFVHASLHQRRRRSLS